MRSRGAHHQKQEVHKLPRLELRCLSKFMGCCMKTKGGIHPMLHLETGSKVHCKPFETSMHPRCSCRSTTGHISEKLSCLHRRGHLVVIVQAAAELLPTLPSIEEDTQSVHKQPGCRSHSGLLEALHPHRVLQHVPRGPNRSQVDDVLQGNLEQLVDASLSNGLLLCKRCGNHCSNSLRSVHWASPSNQHSPDSWWHHLGGRARNHRSWSSPRRWCRKPLTNHCLSQTLKVFLGCLPRQLPNSGQLAGVRLHNLGSQSHLHLDCETIGVHPDRRHILTSLDPQPIQPWHHQRRNYFRQSLSWTLSLGSTLPLMLCNPAGDELHVKGPVALCTGDLGHRDPEDRLEADPCANIIVEAGDLDRLGLVVFISVHKRPDLEHCSQSKCSWSQLAQTGLGLRCKHPSHQAAVQLPQRPHGWPPTALTLDCSDWVVTANASFAPGTANRSPQVSSRTWTWGWRRKKSPAARFHAGQSIGWRAGMVEKTFKAATGTWAKMWHFGQVSSGSKNNLFTSHVDPTQPTYSHVW